jgi:hypothetical protein
MLLGWEQLSRQIEELPGLTEHLGADRNLSIDIVKGWDKKDVDLARPDVQSYAKFVA